MYDWIYIQNNNSQKTLWYLSNPLSWQFEDHAYLIHIYEFGS